MSISSEISRLTSLRTAILSAIRAKGVAVSDGAVLEDCPRYIEHIPSAGENRVGIATAVNDTNSTEIAFTNLAGSPQRFTVVAMAAVNSVAVSSGLFMRTYKPCVIALYYDGETLSGHYTTSSSYNSNNQFSESAFSQSFENGALTLTTTSPYFQSGITYTIFYEY